MVQAVLGNKQIAGDSFLDSKHQQGNLFFVGSKVILQEVLAELRIGEGGVAVLDQNLAELSRHIFVEALQDQISPSAWPKLIRVPKASVTLRPGETSFTSPL